MCSSMGKVAGVGDINTGIQYTLNNGKTVNYLVTKDGLRDIVTMNKAPAQGLTTKELAQRMINSGKGTFLTESQIEELRQNRLKERAERPDYELGNPFGERGRAKRVYRPKRAAR